MPQLTFEHYTSTKTSLLFAQKKTQDEINAEKEEKRVSDLEEMNRQYRQHQMDQQIFRNHQAVQPIFDRMKRN